MFVPILPAGAPTTITIYGAQPGLDGQPQTGSPPGVYLQATVQAQITIGGVLTLNGFIQITAGEYTPAGTNQTPVADLVLVGAVGTTIPFLGALSGEIDLTVSSARIPGVVGQAMLALALQPDPRHHRSTAQFLLEINTFGHAIRTLTPSRSTRTTNSFVTCSSGPTCVGGYDDLEQPDDCRRPLLTISTMGGSLTVGIDDCHHRHHAVHDRARRQ